MNDLASARLCEIVAQYGPGISDEPRKLRALLTDLCPGMPRQVNTLVAAAEQQVVSELRGSAATLPWSILAGRLVRRLVEETAMAEPDAQWVVAAWGKALGRTNAVPDTAPVPATSPTPPAAGADSDRRPASSSPTHTSRSRVPRLLIGVLALGVLALVGWLIYWITTQSRHPEPPPQVQDDEKDKGKGKRKNIKEVERERERNFEEIARLDSEIHIYVKAIAEEDVAVENLEKNISAMRANLERQKRNVRTLRDDLKASNTDYVTHGDTRYPRKEVEKQIERDVAIYQRNVSELKIKEQQLENKKDVLNASLEKLQAMRDARGKLMQKLKTLEDELGAAQTAPDTLEPLRDGPDLSRIRERLRQIEDQNNIERKKRDLEAGAATSPPKAPDLVVEIVGAPAAMRERWYRMGKEALTLEEVIRRLQEQKEKPNPSDRLRVILYQDSPVPDSPVVSKLLEWARDNRFQTTTGVFNRNYSQP